MKSYNSKYPITLNGIDPLVSASTVTTNITPGTPTWRMESRTRAHRMTSAAMGLIELWPLLREQCSGAQMKHQTKP